MKILAFLLVALICNGASYGGDFLKRKYEGWHWYELNQDLEENKEQEMIFKNLTPTEQIKETRALQEKLLHAAIIEPSEENVVKYLRVQKLILDKSFNFTQSYQKVMQIYPELNETTSYPISQIGSQIYQNDKRKHKTRIIREASKVYGLFYFYKVGCPYCDRFVAIIKMFAREYNFELLPISLDGNKHQDLPNTRANIKLVEKLGVKTVPAIYLVESTDKQIIPVSFGFTTFDTLEDRISFILDAKSKEEGRL